MAINERHINQCGSFNVGEKSALLKTFRELEGELTPTAAPAALTDSTAGTPGATLAALTSGSVYATDVANIRSNFASLNAQINAVITALEAAGVLTA